MAAALNNWILHQSGPNEAQLLNKFQIKFRLSSLNDDDINVLEKIRQESRHQDSDGEQLAYEVAAAILLKMHDGVEYLMSNMPPQDIKQFKEWPIYYLHEHRAEPYVLDSTSDTEGWSSVEQRLEQQTIERLNDYRRGTLGGLH